MAEAEKQQALSLKEAEKSALQEKLNNANRQIHELGVDIDKLKRQAASKQEKDRVSNMCYSKTHCLKKRYKFVNWHTVANHILHFSSITGGNN